MKKGIKIFFLFYILLGGCTYSQKNEEYEQFNGGEYLQKSISSAPGKSADKESFEGVLKKYSSHLEILKFEKEVDLSSHFIQKSFYDFSSEKSKKLQELVKQGKGDEMLQKEVNRDLLLAVAYLQNPGLKKAFQKIKIVLSQYSQAAFLEEMVFSYQSFTRDLPIRMGRGMEMNKVADRYPYPSTLSLKGEILNENFEIANQEYQMALRSMVIEILKAYYDVLYLEKSISITQTHKQLLESIHNVTIKLYEGGKTDNSTVLRVQVELSRIADKLITLEQERKTSLAALNRELSRPSSSSFGPFQEKNLEVPKHLLPDFLQIGRKNSQEIQIASRDVKRMELMVALLRERFHPDFVQGKSYLEENMNFYGVKKNSSFSTIPRAMPRFWFASQESYLREVEEEAERARDEKKRMEDKIFFQIEKVYYEMDKANREARLYEDSLLPRSRQAYQVAMRGYEGGKVGFDSLIDAERVLLEFQLRFYQAVQNRNNKILELMGVTGKWE